MRKAMLIFLCFALIGVMISCNNADNTCLNNTGTTQMTDTVQNAYSKKEASKKQVFRNYDDILDRYRALLLIRYNNSNIENPQIYLDENDYKFVNAILDNVLC